MPEARLQRCRAAYIDYSWLEAERVLLRSLDTLVPPAACGRDLREWPDLTDDATREAWARAAAFTDLHGGEA